MLEQYPTSLPALHKAWIDHAMVRLSADERVVGVAAAGSYVDDALDAFSDLDLVVAIEPSAQREVLEQRPGIAARLGPLLACFTGEHVGEPRLLICLYGPPLLHVDLKFVALDDAAARVDEPVVLWERSGRLTAALAKNASHYPMHSSQWIEDRFWIWVHYAATKIGRGELFEALDFLSFLRGTVLGPLGLRELGLRPTGVRKLEMQAPALAQELKSTVAQHEPASLVRAVYASVAIYWRLRGAQGGDTAWCSRAEAAAMNYLGEIRDGIAG